MSTLIELAAQLVSTQSSKTTMNTDQLISEIQKVHAGLKRLESGQQVQEEELNIPRISIKDAFRKNEVVCLICGKGGLKTLTRHLKAAHDMKPSEYRKHFGIPRSQSLCAKSYVQSRRQMALDRGLAEKMVQARAARIEKIEVEKSAPAVAEETPVAEAAIAV